MQRLEIVFSATVGNDVTERMEASFLFVLLLGTL